MRTVQLLFAAVAGQALAGCNCGEPAVVVTGTMGGSGDATASSAPQTSTSAAATGSTGSDSSSTSTSTGAEPPPYPEACYEPEALIEVTVAQTPDGPLRVDEAWLGVDYCSRAPYVTLAQIASADGPGIEVEILLIDEGTTGDTFLGTYPTLVGFEQIGTIEVLEPVGPFEPLRASAENYLHARIEVHEAGWDLSVEVGLLDCGVADCFCPCE